MFYNWYEIGYLDNENYAKVSTFISGYDEGWEETNARLGELCKEHILSTPTDFTFLYLGFLDEWGHRYGWLSDEYYYALNQSFSVIKTVIDEAVKMDYTIIVTTDHGGHDYTHGTTMAEDMTIPLFIIGDGYNAPGGNDLGKRSILDVAPTVLDILDVKAPSYWQGSAISIS
jgi:predicted AlkP superfamily pyrophosphatase or phosphodiesterase